MRDQTRRFRGWRPLWSPSHILWQSLVVLGVWVFLWRLHPTNDGLWFQGDAPRHAANGFFWIDYLSDFTLDAKSYALSYYARYPVIDPAGRPPVFYLLEGVAFQVLGPSPYVAKGLVLCFALLAALYLMAWLREWISAEAAWAAGLFLLLPGIVRWSHAIMLNVPAFAFGLGALYHARRWLEMPAERRRDFVLATLLTLLGILTYFPTGVVIFVVASWIAIRGDWVRWLEGKSIVAVGCCALVLLPLIWHLAHWAPTQLGWVLPTAATVGMLSTWTFYPLGALDLVNLHVLCLAGLGVFAGFAQRRWRRETMILTSWIVVLYVVFSLLFAKDERYALPVLAPLIGLYAIGVLSLCEWLIRTFRNQAMDGRTLATLVLLISLAWQVSRAARYHVASISGYQEVVSFLEQAAPEEPVLYDGFYDGIFTFYMRAGDERFRRRVVLGNKLLYAFAMVPGWRQQSFVDSPEDVVRVLQQRGGCRWIAIEVSPRDRELLPMQHLRDAVATSAFELVRSFSIDAPAIDRVDVYRIKLPVAEAPVVELPFPILGSDVKYRVRPIPSRRSG